MSRTLLVADDAVIIREMIKSTAKKGGWEVVAEASNGQEAVERYTALKPDAVTLDLVMPEYDGLYALRGILSKDPGAKVLVVSAIEQRSVLKEAFKAGASDFIVKPFDRQALLESLNKVVPGASEPAAAVQASV